MLRIVALATAALLAGCGVDSMSAAATAATAKQKEVEQGKKNMEQAQQNINQAMQQSQQGAERASDSADRKAE
jgi:surface antigen